MYKKSIMLFRRDLRLQDNTALCHATSLSDEVIPLFIFDTRQVSENNSYRSDNALDFMVTSLHELDQESKKHKGIFSYGYGIADEVLEKIFRKEKIEALFFNRDYTPFSQARDERITELCEQYNIVCHGYDDLTLTVPGSILNGNNSPYSIYTPFYKKALQVPVAKPIKITNFKFIDQEIHGLYALKEVLSHVIYEKNSFKYVHGGTKEGLEILRDLKVFNNYDKMRDFPNIQTTFLAAHIKFGTVSIRQVYYAVLEKTENITLIKQLYWRDFFIHLAYHFAYVFKKAFRKEYQSLEWTFNKKHFAAWCEGKTGFPIVDAGMRQLNKTGYMHNRVRMIVASFLTKNLHINWQEGERYFAQKLTDYDPAVNNGSWQWVASTGADAQPYFRIFNPWLQQKKFDPECLYIKHWVPELKNISPAAIHNYYKNQKEMIVDYVLPIVDHAVTSAYTKRFLKK